MTASRQRMLVIGKTPSTVPKIKELTGEKLDVISANDVRLPDASADYVVVDSSEPQLMSDLQVCAMGLLSALPDGIVLLDDDLNILWHNTTFRQLLRTAETHGRAAIAGRHSSGGRNRPAADRHTGEFRRSCIADCSSRRPQFAGPATGENHHQSGTEATSRR